MPVLFLFVAMFKLLIIRCLVFLGIEAKIAVGTKYQLFDSIIWDSVSELKIHYFFFYYSFWLCGSFDI